MTIVPVRELTIILAAMSAGLNSKFSSVDKYDTRWDASRGAITRIETESIACALFGPTKSLIVFSRRFAVVKSGRFKLKVM